MLCNGVLLYKNADDVMFCGWILYPCLGEKTLRYRNPNISTHHLDLQIDVNRYCIDNDSFTIYGVFQRSFYYCVNTIRISFIRYIYERKNTMGEKCIFIENFMNIIVFLLRDFISIVDVCLKM